MTSAIQERQNKIESIKQILKEEQKEAALDVIILKLRGLFPGNQKRKIVDYLEIIQTQGLIKIDKASNKIIKNEAS